MRRLAVPATAGALFGLVFNLTDNLVAGFWSTDAQSALGFSFPLFYVVLAFSVGLTRAGTGLVSRALGAGKRKEAARCSAQFICSSFLAGIAITVIGLPLAEPLVRSLGANSEQARLTLQYIAWIFAFAPIFITTMAVSGVLSAHGNTHTYRNALGAAAVLNMVLDPVLMFGWLGFPALGMHGLAIATVATQVMMLFWLLAVAIRSGALGGIQRRQLTPDWGMQRRIANQAAPPTLNMLSINFGFFVYTYYLGHIDAKAVAAFAIAHRIDQVVQLLASGFSVGLLAVAGQNFGAGKFDRMSESFRSADRHAVTITVAGGAIMLVAGQALMWMFNREAVIIGYGYSYLVAAALIGPMHAALHNCVSMMQAVGRPAMIVPLSALRMVVLPPLLCWAFVTVAGLGVNGVWASLLVSNLVVVAIVRIYTKGLLRSVVSAPA